MTGRNSFSGGRSRLLFRAVNRRGQPGHDPALQRHHLLPRQLLNRDCFGSMFAALGRERIGFDDFRINGLLLPASEHAARRTALPLHRGPHRDYNAMVIERVGCVEEAWAEKRRFDAEIAARDALQRLQLLQKALRRRLLDEARPLLLNRRDPVAADLDFSDLDAIAEALWSAAA
ncbi:AHH domain-containing protein [Qipengyuania gaetbuli]|uniref:AHH domain-containing protein n=1 Tax=Qipengyuania gaetbuli TaxID=266952 RepID=UPI001CFC922F|nr:AHH domain-containing protein [Qipengyuania gaetbuli]